MLGHLLAVLLLATDGGTTAPKQPRRFVVPEVLSTIDIPGEQKAIGVPMKLIAVRSRANVEEVRRSLMKQFHEAGLYVPPAGDITLHQTTIVGLDPVSLIAYSAVLRPNEDGTSTAVLGTSFLQRAERAGLPDWGPVYPGATAVVTTDVELMRTATYSVNKSEAEVRQFYDTVMPGAGFAKLGADMYRKGGEQISLAYSPLSPQGVSVLMTHQRGVHGD